MIALLVIEYILGMATSLFVEFPEDEKGMQLWKFAMQETLVSIHIVVSLLLFIGTIIFVIRALKHKKRQWLIASSIATVAILGGIGTGSAFITSQNDWYSFVMSISLIIALLAYYWGIYVSRSSAQ